MAVVCPRPNFFFIFYSEDADTYWVVPSLQLVKEANRNKGGKDGNGRNKGKYTIKLANFSKTKQRAVPRPRFRRYENNFDLLRSALNGGKRRT